MGRGFRLKIQFIECETKIEVSLGEIRISLDRGREMILGDRPMFHLIVNDAVGIVPSGGGIAVGRRGQGRVYPGTSVLQHDQTTGGGKSNEIHGPPAGVNGDGCSRCAAEPLTYWR